jgi:hypothetical protein
VAEKVLRATSMNQKFPYILHVGLEFCSIDFLRPGQADFEPG